ncbi:hypothetical protein [Streptomyces formicae]
MARLQILELPEGAGDDRPPFVLVIDQVDDGTALDIARWPDDISKRLGARHVVCFTDTVDIPANDVQPSTDEAFKTAVQDWAAGTNETLRRIVEAMSHKPRPRRGPHPAPASHDYATDA